MNKVFLFALATALLFASCSKSDISSASTIENFSIEASNSPETDVRSLKITDGDLTFIINLLGDSIISYTISDGKFTNIANLLADSTIESSMISTPTGLVKIIKNAQQYRIESTLPGLPANP